MIDFFAELQEQVPDVVPGALAASISGSTMPLRAPEPKQRVGPVAPARAEPADRLRTLPTKEAGNHA